MTNQYGIYEDESRTREIFPSQFYRTIAGTISRVQMKSLDVSVGREDNPDAHILELTVDLRVSAGPMLGSGSTRTFKLRTPKAIAGLMRDLEAKLLPELLRKEVLTHYDADQSPAYVAISHPDNVRHPRTF